MGSDIRAMASGRRSTAQLFADQDRESGAPRIGSKEAFKFAKTMWERGLSPNNIRKVLEFLSIPDVMIFDILHRISEEPHE